MATDYKQIILDFAIKHKGKLVTPAMLCELARITPPFRNLNESTVAKWMAKLLPRSRTGEYVASIPRHRPGEQMKLI